MVDRLDNNAIVAVDVALITVAEGGVRVLVVPRPDDGSLALPGVLVQPEETLEGAAHRALHDKAGLGEVYLEQLYTFGEPERDPRGRVVTVAYYALVPAHRLVQRDDARLVDAASPPPLAFDHARIVRTVVDRLRGKIAYSPIGYELLPETFTLRQLRAVHEAILGRPLNKDSFRRRMLDSGQLDATGTREERVAYRPAELYRRV